MDNFLNLLSSTKLLSKKKNIKVKLKFLNFNSHTRKLSKIIQEGKTENFLFLTLLLNAIRISLGECVNVNFQEIVSDYLFYKIKLYGLWQGFLRGKAC